MSYAQSAASVYDAIYTSIKDYGAEAGRLRTVLRQYQRSSGRELLDVACGTGLHDQYLSEWYNVTGLDLSPEMLKVARRRNPNITYRTGNMTAFNLGRQYDVVTNLFSAIGHIKPSELEQTIRTHARHLLPGGVLAIEPWLLPHMWRDRYLGYNLVELPDLLIVRTSRTARHGNITKLELSHLVVTPECTEHFVERHEVTMFTEAEFKAAFTAAGLESWYLAEGLSDNGRGLFIARRPIS